MDTHVEIGRKYFNASGTCSSTYAIVKMSKEGSSSLPQIHVPARVCTCARNTLISFCIISNFDRNLLTNNTLSSTYI